MLVAIPIGLAAMVAMWFFFALIPMIAFAGFLLLYGVDQLFRKR
jgi:hypothetical protein